MGIQRGYITLHNRVLLILFYVQQSIVHLVKGFSVEQLCRQ